jgi:hypothetical protein
MSVVFVDESKNRKYTLVAAVIEPRKLATMRQALRALVLPGQRRLHFTHESDARRRAVLSRLVELEVAAHVFQSGLARERDAREECLGELVAFAVREGHRRIVLERDASIEKSDRRILFRELRARGAGDGFQYEFEGPIDEPLLWIPDAVAWSFVKGGDWRRRIAPIVQGVTTAGA